MIQASPGDLTIRVMNRADLNLAIEWAAAEGWNPGLNDDECFQAADPKGFLMEYRGEEPIASISVIRYSDTFGFLGLYIVRPDQRGQGFGYRLWKAGLAYLEGCTIGLDGVVAQQENYARSGFVLAHRNIRFGGSPQVEVPVDRRLHLVEGKTIPAVLNYDRPFFPSPRQTFLRCWLRPEERVAITYIEEGEVKGYGVMRTCRTGFKIGPLFADGEHQAGLIFEALAARAGKGPVFLDLPEPNGTALRLAARYGLSPVFETARMYRGTIPNLSLSRTYGISTFELG